MYAVGQKNGFARCGDQAKHRVSEEIMHDDPNQIRHPLTSYLCCNHYGRCMGYAYACYACVDN